MSTFLFSVSLPDETHSNIEVRVEQVGEPSVDFTVSVPNAMGQKVESDKGKPKSIGKAAPTVTDDYALGGYAGI